MNTRSTNNINNKKKEQNRRIVVIRKQKPLETYKNNKKWSEWIKWRRWAVGFVHWTRIKMNKKWDWKSAFYFIFIFLFIFFWLLNARESNLKFMNSLYIHLYTLAFDNLFMCRKPYYIAFHLHFVCIQNCI